MSGITVGRENSTPLDSKDWGTGRPVVFSHGWALTADAREDQMRFLASRGYHCIAHDRRGHGRSTGGGGVARYIGRYGTKRVARAVLISAVPPLMLKSEANPDGLAIELFDGFRAALAKDRSQAYRDFAQPFYGANRPGAQVSQGLLDQFWLWSMQAGLKN